MDKTHTPGPWKADTVINSTDLHMEIYIPNRTLAYVLHYPNDTTTNETTANARLIAAAPELLEKLEKMTRLLSFLYHNGRIKENAPGRERIQQAIIDAEYAIEKATQASE